MCWNAEVSLSTFIFAVSSMTIGYLNNTETGKWLTLYITIACMQLLEYFIWKNLKYKKLNKLLSICGLVIILLQPLAAGLLIVNKNYQKVFYILYILWMIIFLADNHPFTFTTTVSKNGHLSWNWLKIHDLYTLTWTMFVIIAIALSEVKHYQKSLIIVFIIALTYISWYIYKKDGTWGSIYCSFMNVIFFVVIIKSFWKHYSGKYGSCFSL